MVATKAGQRRIRLRSPGAPEAQCTTTDMVIHIHHHGGKIWLPRGGNASVPIQSTIQLANGAMIAAADDNPADLIFQTHAIESATPGSKVILLGDAVLKTLPGKPIELLGKQSNKLRLPPGTLLQFGTPSTPHRVVPFGGGSLCSRRMLRDVLTLSDASSVALPQPMTLGPGGFTLQGDMALPQSVILTGNMAVSSGSIILPEPPELDEQYVLEVVIDGLFRETYVPGTQLRNGTVLPWATRLPAGTVLKQGLHIPGGITLPTGTLIPAGTSLPRGTMLPAGLLLPEGTLVPSQVDRDLSLLGPDKKIGGCPRAETCHNAKTHPDVKDLSIRGRSLKECSGVEPAGSSSEDLITWDD